MKLWWSHVSGRALFWEFASAAVCVAAALFWDSVAWWFFAGYFVRSTITELVTMPVLASAEVIRKSLVDTINASTESLHKSTAIHLELHRTIKDQELFYRAQLMAIAVREQMGMRPVVPDVLREHLIHQARESGDKPQQPIKVYETTSEPS